jgi:hypothetical protein
VPPLLSVPVVDGVLVKAFIVMVLLPLLMVQVEGKVMAYV